MFFCKFLQPFLQNFKNFSTGVFDKMPNFQPNIPQKNWAVNFYQVSAKLKPWTGKNFDENGFSLAKCELKLFKKRNHVLVRFCAALTEKAWKGVGWSEKKAEGCRIKNIFSRSESCPCLFHHLRFFLLCARENSPLVSVSSSHLNSSKLSIARNSSRSNHTFRFSPHCLISPNSQLVSCLPVMHWSQLTKAFLSKRRQIFGQFKIKIFFKNSCLKRKQSVSVNIIVGKIWKRSEPIFYILCNVWVVTTRLSGWWLQELFTADQQNVQEQNKHNRRACISPEWLLRFTICSLASLKLHTC